MYQSLLMSLHELSILTFTMTLWGRVIIPIFIHKEIEGSNLSQVHPTSKSQSQDSNPGLSDFNTYI